MKILGEYTLDDANSITAGESILFRGSFGGESCWMVAEGERKASVIGRALERSGQFIVWPEMEKLLAPFLENGTVVHDDLVSTDDVHAFDVIGGENMPLVRTSDGGTLF